MLFTNIVFSCSSTVGGAEGVRVSAFTKDCLVCSEEAAGCLTVLAEEIVGPVGVGSEEV
jgi:hypothetical protein